MIFGEWGLLMVKQLRTLAYFTKMKRIQPQQHVQFHSTTQSQKNIYLYSFIYIKNNMILWLH